MDWDLAVRVLYFTIGVVAVLSFGHLVWNYRLVYYRFWCWWNYKYKGHAFDRRNRK